MNPWCCLDSSRLERLFGACGKGLVGEDDAGESWDRRPVADRVSLSCLLMIRCRGLTSFMLLSVKFSLGVCEIMGQSERERERGAVLFELSLFFCRKISGEKRKTSWMTSKNLTCLDFITAAAVVAAAAVVCVSALHQPISQPAPRLR